MSRHNWIISNEEKLKPVSCTLEKYNDREEIVDQGIIFLNLCVRSNTIHIPEHLSSCCNNKNNENTPMSVRHSFIPI